MSFSIHLLCFRTSLSESYKLAPAASGFISNAFHPQQSSERGKHSKIVIKPSARALKAQQMDAGFWLVAETNGARCSTKSCHPQQRIIISSASQMLQKKTKKNSNGSILHFNAASWWHKFSNLLYLCICSPTPDTDTDDIDVVVQRQRMRK